MHHLAIRTIRYTRRLSKFIGPGFMIAVGYLDPGNWATDMEGGSRFGYKLLFIVLVSNIIAIFLQSLTIRLGTVTGLDLAAACRQFLPRYVNLFLYILAELSIVATDLAEVIGSAIALNLLFPSLPLPAGVAITAADVFLVLLFYQEPDDLATSNTGNAESRRSRQKNLLMIRWFEVFVMLLVAAVGVCFIVELVYSDIVAVEVLKGYLPSKEIFADSGALYVAIGIIGATVMPHNLFLHSYIVQARCYKWRDNRPVVKSITAEPQCYTVAFAQLSPASTRNNLETFAVSEKQIQSSNSETFPEQDNVNDSDDLDTSERQSRELLDVDTLRHYLRTNLSINLHYGFVDLFIALLFAFFVNSAILIVASANFHYGHLHVVSDLFDAHALLQQYLGPAAAIVFSLALLFSGQSSTLTATLAGQVVMSGFLGMSGRPWIRRIVTRLIAIIPAMVAACVAGRSGLSQMLVASQVALSIQLPFAVVPLVWFTSTKKVMHLHLIHNAKRDLSPALPVWLDTLIDRSILYLEATSSKFARYIQLHRCAPSIPRRQSTNEDMNSACVTMESPSEVTMPSLPEPIYYSNGRIMTAIAVFIALLLIGLNFYLVVTSIIPQ
ncbi:natural resistance-associated macrophage protein [Hesseltinella vesiculosa]|uniref:Natural resistance-associated macrophage protein n=1 Tax=Hesseltinella vesiculosa TaxID=101127 RepID=A0A1X2GA97_9FUNG|nr:natural resistance-associated macrophage protein [Hesseltinella vesiculosa]